MDRLLKEMLNRALQGQHPDMKLNEKGNEVIGQVVKILEKKDTLSGWEATAQGSQMQNLYTRKLNEQGVGAFYNFDKELTEDEAKSIEVWVQVYDEPGATDVVKLIKRVHDFMRIKGLGGGLPLTLYALRRVFENLCNFLGSEDWTGLDVAGSIEIFLRDAVHCAEYWADPWTEPGHTLENPDKIPKHQARRYLPGMAAVMEARMNLMAIWVDDALLVKSLLHDKPADELGLCPEVKDAVYTMATMVVEARKSEQTQLILKTAKKTQELTVAAELVFAL